jgi:imidazolonepropionase-like amidohydrolase
MKKLLRIALVSVAILFIVIIIVYRIWFYNPYHDRLYLNPESIFHNDAASNYLLINHATIIDIVSGKAVQDAHILIQGETIVDVFVGDTPDIPTNVKMLDAQGKFIMPGIIDVHAHLFMHWHLSGGNFKPQDSLVTRAALEQFVRYGVTSVLAFGGGGSNDEQAAELKRLEQSNSIVSPLLHATGDVITVPGSHPVTTIMRLPADTEPDRLHQAGVTVIDENDDPSSVVSYKKQLGLDGVKIIIESGPPPWYPNPKMSPATAENIIEHARKHDLPVYAHVQVFDEFSEAVRLGVNGIMHSVMDKRVDDFKLIELMKQQRIWYVPTLSLLYGFQTLKDPQRLNDEFLQAGVSKRTLRGLEHPLFRFGFGRSIGKVDLSHYLNSSLQNLLRLHESGVLIALGTDASTPFTFPGYSAHIEMELMTRAGLSNADVLRIATLNGAAFLGIDDIVGTIEPGKIANLLILDKNPFSDIRNTRSIDMVILKGYPIDPKISTY